MSKQKVEIHRLKKVVAKLEAEAEELREGLAKALAQAEAYGERLEQVRGAHLIRLLKEAGIEYQLNTARWAVILPSGILDVESLPVAIQSIRDAATPPTADQPRHDDPALLGETSND